MSIPIRVEAPDPEMLSGVSVTEWRGGFQAALPVKVHRDGNALVLTAEADCRAGSALVFESPKGIGVASLDEHCSAGVHVRLSIRSDVSAHFVTPRGAPRPRWGMIRLGRCGVEGQTIEVPFAIHQDLLQTAVPAECGGVSLYVAGYAPIHPAVQEIRGGTSYDLGVLTLRPGAAVVLRVRSGRRGDPLEGVRVTAVRASQLAAVRGTLNLESLSLGSAVTNAAGWARLTGLPDDRLVFLLNARGRKYPQMSEEYELPAGNETVIDDVILQPAANILVTLSVPDRLRDVVSLDAVELGATDDMRWPAHVPIRADLTPAGAVLADVPPGRYRLHATGRIKQGFALRVGEADITVTSGVDQTVPLTLNGSLYSGRVTRSGLAVAGTINLKPADRSTSRRPSVARLDTDGDFYVLLDGPGKYSVYVQTPNHDSVTLGEYVEFGDAGAPVEIELPAGRLTGRVVDSAGTAVTGVIVTARQNVAEPAAEVAGLAGEDGSFTLEGVSSGAWEVSAESQSERSEPLLVAIEDDDVEGITLVVDPTYSVNLRVIDVGGEPLRDVFVTAEFPRVGAEPKVYGGGSRLNGEVNFRLARSEQSKPTNVVLRANDGRLACETLTLNHDQIIQLPSFTGAARIVIAAGFTEAGARNWLIAPSGCAVPFVVRPEMESGGEESMLFRRLVPGEWRFVQSHSPEELAAVLAGRGALLAPIKRFVVARGITTRVPVSPAN
jgi:hypothetical protein